MCVIIREFGPGKGCPTCLGVAALDFYSNGVRRRAGDNSIEFGRLHDVLGSTILGGFTKELLLSFVKENGT